MSPSEFLVAQKNDAYYRSVLDSADSIKSPFIVDANGFFCRVSKLDGTRAKVVPGQLRRTILDMGHD